MQSDPCLDFGIGIDMTYVNADACDVCNIIERKLRDCWIDLEMQDEIQCPFMCESRLS